MHLYTPRGLLYPIKVTRLLRKPGDEIVENAPLFDYEYKSKVREGIWTAKDGNTDHEVERTWPATFESEFEGTLNSLSVRVGQHITGRTLVADVEEACKHEVQFGGLCADCGKDMKEVKSYNTTVQGTDRATYNTIHDRHGMHTVLVSKDETERADHEAKRRLLDARQLVLVVDLDQTVIQCCVEETIGEWKNDPSNPNYEALKDVHSFRLPRDDKTYYVKPRPGLRPFLLEVSRYYEMHVYTMASRDYAEQVMDYIDPDRMIFGTRVLSRDENGQKDMVKALERLFPADTSMVAIIDDRGDVWKWSPNLVKVKAYDFFVGVGDINSSFLPKQHVIEAAKPVKPQAEKSTKTEEPTTENNVAKEDGEADDGSETPPSTTPTTAAGLNGAVSAVDLMVSMAEDQDGSTLEEKKHEHDETLANQLAERPLLQKQKILDAAEEAAKDLTDSPAVEEAAEILKEDGLEKKETTSTDQPKYRHNLLQDDDTELEYLGQNLLDVHDAFYEQYEQGLSAAESGRVAELRPGQTKKPEIHEKIPDVAVIMNSIKSRVLGDVHLVFSGVVPLGVNIHTYDTVIWAKSFGAKISENITKKTTHVIASPERRTAKVRQAAKKGGRISIVNSGWLFACFSQWIKVDEGPFRIHSDAPANGQPALPDSFEDKELGTLSSSDEEAALTEAEAEDDGGNEGANGTHLSVDTDTDEEELAKYAPKDGPEDGSPIEEQEPEEWDDIDAELADFMGDSDFDDSDAPDASESEGESDAGKSTASAESTPTGQKRKRDATAADVPPASDPEEGSRLQKRKKEALGRTTSLTNMASVTSGAVSAVDASEPAKLDGVEEEQNGDDDDDDDFDADLEAALAAEMEKDEDDGGEADGET
jgi:RNA polymerase II subunit A-like phosphatase